MEQMASYGRLIGDIIKLSSKNVGSPPLFVELVEMKVTLKHQASERRQLTFQGLTAVKALWTCCNAGS